jgi:hypothetical protein
LGKGRGLLISMLIAGHDGDIPHLVSPRWWTAVSRDHAGGR